MIDKSDEMTVIKQIFTITMSWEAYDNMIVCYDMNIKYKMSKNLLKNSGII